VPRVSCSPPPRPFRPRRPATTSRPTTRTRWKSKGTRLVRMRRSVRIEPALAKLTGPTDASTFASRETQASRRATFRWCWLRRRGREGWSSGRDWYGSVHGRRGGVTIDESKTASGRRLGDAEPWWSKAELPRWDYPTRLCVRCRRPPRSGSFIPKSCSSEVNTAS
jgi:hypothetical protein